MKNNHQNKQVVGSQFEIKSLSKRRKSVRKKSNNISSEKNLSEHFQTYKKPFQTEFSEIPIADTKRHSVVLGFPNTHAIDELKLKDFVRPFLEMI